MNQETSSFSSSNSEVLGAMSSAYQREQGQQEERNHNGRQNQNGLPVQFTSSQSHRPRNLFLYLSQCKLASMTNNQKNPMLFQMTTSALLTTDHHTSSPRVSPQIAAGEPALSSSRSSPTPRPRFQDSKHPDHHQQKPQSKASLGSNSIHLGSPQANHLSLWFSFLNPLESPGKL